MLNSNSVFCTLMGFFERFVEDKYLLCETKQTCTFKDTKFLPRLKVNLLLQAMKVNKADWSTLFEPYPFFEAYKNYLEIDITAENEDDLRKWKGWVESRLRQLTLKVVRHIFLYLFI